MKANSQYKSTKTEQASQLQDTCTCAETKGIDESAPMKKIMSHCSMLQISSKKKDPESVLNFSKSASDDSSEDDQTPANCIGSTDFVLLDKDNSKLSKEEAPLGKRKPLAPSQPIPPQPYSSHIPAYTSHSHDHRASYDRVYMLKYMCSSLSNADMIYGSAMYMQCLNDKRKYFNAADAKIESYFDKRKEGLSRLLQKF